MKGLASSRPTRLALVGLGHWGQVLLRSIAGKSDKVTFVAAVSRNPERARDLAQIADIALLPDLQAALSDPEIDGLVLATPHSLHGEQIAKCRMAGKPVLVEKPFTLTRESADHALAAGKGAVFAAHNRRFLPAAQAILAAAHAGNLGQILHIDANFSGNVVGRYTHDMWRSDISESPAGGLAGAGIHLIDLIIALEGPLASVSAQSSRRVEGLPIDDTMSANFRLASGASAMLSCVMATISLMRLQVFGTKGAATLDGPNRAIFDAIDGSRQNLDFPSVDIERAELEAFAAAIRGEAPYPVPMADVLNGISAFEAITRSIETGTSQEITR